MRAHLSRHVLMCCVKFRVYNGSVYWLLFTCHLKIYVNIATSTFKAIGTKCNKFREIFWISLSDIISKYLGTKGYHAGILQYYNMWRKRIKQDKQTTKFVHYFSFVMRHYTIGWLTYKYYVSRQNDDDLSNRSYPNMLILKLNAYI